MPNNKILYISLIQSFAVILVVIGHSLNFQAEAMPQWAILINNIIYSFHMPLFFVLSGFLLAYSLKKREKSFFDFVFNKIKRLIIPYIVIATCAYLLKIIFFNKFAYSPAEASIQFYLHSLLYPSENPNKYLWFLPTLFLILIPSYFFAKNKISAMILLLCSACLHFCCFCTNIKILSINSVCLNTIYVAIGICLFMYKQTIFNIIKKNITTYVIAIFYLILFFIKYKLGIEQKINNISIVSFVIANLGIFLTFSIFIKIEKTNTAIFEPISNYYYQIYLLSWFSQCLLRILYQLGYVNYITVAILMTVGGIYFPIIFTKLAIKFFKKYCFLIGC